MLLHQIKLNCLPWLRQPPLIYQAMSHLRSGILESSNTVPMVTVNLSLQLAHQRSPARVLAAALGLMSENFVWSLHLHFGQTTPFFQRTPSRCLRALSSVPKRSNS